MIFNQSVVYFLWAISLCAIMQEVQGSGHQSLFSLPMFCSWGLQVERHWEWGCCLQQIHLNSAKNWNGTCSCPTTPCFVKFLLSLQFMHGQNVEKLFEWNACYAGRFVTKIKLALVSWSWTFIGFLVWYNCVPPSGNSAMQCQFQGCN